MQIELMIWGYRTLRALVLLILVILGLRFTPDFMLTLASRAS